MPLIVWSVSLVAIHERRVVLACEEQIVRQLSVHQAAALTEKAKC